MRAYGGVYAGTVAIRDGSVIGETFEVTCDRLPPLGLDVLLRNRLPAIVTVPDLRECLYCM